MQDLEGLPNHHRTKLTLKKKKRAGAARRASRLLRASFKPSSGVRSGAGAGRRAPRIAAGWLDSRRSRCQGCWRSDQRPQTGPAAEPSSFPRAAPSACVGAGWRGIILAACVRFFGGVRRLPVMSNPRGFVQTKKNFMIVYIRFRMIFPNH